MWTSEIRSIGLSVYRSGETSRVGCASLGGLFRGLPLFRLRFFNANVPGHVPLGARVDGQAEEFVHTPDGRNAIDGTLTNRTGGEGHPNPCPPTALIGAPRSLTEVSWECTIRISCRDVSHFCIAAAQSCSSYSVYSYQSCLADVRPDTLVLWWRHSQRRCPGSVEAAQTRTRIFSGFGCRFSKSHRERFLYAFGHDCKIADPNHRRPPRWHGHPFVPILDRARHQ